MSDESIRALERAPKDDEVARQRLEAAWIRRGLGWHGESLPDGLSVGRERGIYGWRISPGGVDVELVYVAGGEVPCDHREPGVWASPNGKWCDFCRGSNARTIAPFYLGRFPVMNREWALQPGARVSSTVRESIDLLPLVNVTRGSVAEWCSWAGLRLPSEAEWKWAALGSPRFEWVPPGKFSVSGHWAARRFPWGNERPDDDRCVWIGHSVHGRRDFQTTSGNLRGSAAPVAVEVEAARRADEARRVVGLQPARPAGASWCGAHDMCGNVWEITSSFASGYPLMLGGSFRSIDDDPFRGEEGLRRSLAWGGPAAQAGDDVGFRVALSSVAS